MSIYNCTFINNRAAKNGGAIAAVGDVPDDYEIFNCTFISNSAGNSGGAFYSHADKNMGSIINSTFIDNRAHVGDAIYNYGEYGDIVRCVFVNNTANSMIWGKYAEMVISNSIIVNNYGDNLVDVQNPTFDYNWWGTTADDDAPVVSGNTLTNYYFLDMGVMPTVKSMIDSNTHTLRKWETDLSSQTGASQVGILHGNNEDITAFRWIEKENGNQMMQCSGITKVKVLEERISDGNGLLVEKGASRSNLFSGDTDNVIFTFSKITDLRKLYNGAWYSIFSKPGDFARIVVLVAEDMVHEIISQLKHRLFDIRPRISRGIAYIPTRAGTNVFMREINTETLIGDMLVGDVDVAYSTYLGYDEIAHRSGVRDEDAWFALKGMDRQIRRLLEGNRYAPRQYQFVIQSDHGQTNGATFKQRHGESFEDFVKSLLPQDTSMYANMSSNEDHFAEVYILFSDKIRRFMNRNSEDEERQMMESEVIVLASGNLAMVYFTRWSHRMTYEEITEVFPEMIPSIVANEYVGFVLVRSSEMGDMAIGKGGTYYLERDEVDGENPLEGFGDNIVQHLKRSSSFKYPPDILVNSFCDAENDEVCAFEELVGSHGGVGGSQSEPFILYPSDWNVPDEEIVGAENIYNVLKTNLGNIKENAKR